MFTVVLKKRLEITLLRKQDKNREGVSSAAKEQD